MTSSKTADSTQPPTLSDTLAALPIELHRSIFNGGVLVSIDKRNARLACRALRDGVDGTAEAASLLYWLRLLEVAAACPDGWLLCWPRLGKLTLPFNDAERLGLPLAAAPPATPAAWGRITELELGSKHDFQADPLPSSALSDCLARLPGLHSLTLHTVPPDADGEAAWGLDSEDWSPEQRLTSQALSSLPNLTSLTTSWYSYLPYLPSNLLQQQTRIEADAHHDNDIRPPQAEVGDLTSRLTSLRELKLIRVRKLQLQVYGPSITCSLEGGLLTDVAVSGEAARYTYLADLLAEGLLKSRALGPRLPTLSVDYLLLDAQGIPAAEADPGGRAAAALLARCDRVTVSTLAACRLDDTLAASRMLSLPETLIWASQVPYCGGLELRLRRPPAFASAAGGGGGAGQAWRAPLPPLLSLEALLQRVVERMERAGPGKGSDEGSGWKGDLLLRGPLMEALASNPAAQQAWLVRLGDRIGAAGRHRRAGPRCLPLPAVGAAVVTQIPEHHTEAVAAAARQLAAEGGGGTGAAELQVQRCGLDFRGAVAQVLQALWEGDAEEEDAGGEVGSELERLERLLEVGRELLELAPADRGVNGGGGFWSDGDGDTDECESD